jgi:putative membrane protein
MDAQPETKRADLRDYLAAERTLLAWIRTGLALMGFGFVVARFGVFLREIEAALPAEKSFGLSLWFGTALIGVGIFVNLFAAWRHARMVRELNRGEEIQFRPSMLIIAIACVLALIGLVMAIYLISLQTSAGRQPENRKETSMSLSQGAGSSTYPAIIRWKRRSV